MTTEATPDAPLSLTPTPRPPLALLLVLHAVLTAVRPALERLSGAGVIARIDDLIARGELGAVRSLLADYLPPVASADVPPTAYGAAAAALRAVLDVAGTLGAAPRKFHARVSLVGHCDLGVCYVEEERLAGADVLRCVQLCTEEPVVRWVRAQSIYNITELSEKQAAAEAREAEANRRQARARDARRRLEREEQMARVRAARAAATAIIRVDEESGDVTVEATVLDALDSRHEDLLDVLHREADVDEWEVTNLRAVDGGPYNGVCIHGGAENRRGILAAIGTLGFASVEVAS